MAKKKITCYTKKKNDGSNYTTCLPAQKKAKRKAAKKAKKRRTIFDRAPAARRTSTQAGWSVGSVVNAGPATFSPPQQPFLASFLQATAIGKRARPGLEPKKRFPIEDLGKRKRIPKKRFDIEGY